MNLSVDDIFHIVGYSLAGLGLIIAAWTLAVRDVRKSRRGPRCPRCWYDMSGATAGAVGSEVKLICPECGRDAKSPRRLFKRRRHWRMAVIAMLLVAIGYGVWAAPRMRRTGWAGAVPTTAIIAGLPWMDPVGDRLVPWAVGRWRKTGVAGRLSDELLSQRLARDPLWEWQARLLAWRCVAGDRARPACSLAWEEFYEPILDGLENRGVRQSVALNGRAAIFRELVGRLDDMGSMQVVCREGWPAGVPIYARVEPFRYRHYLDDTRWELAPVTPGLRAMNGVRLNPFGLSCGGSITDYSPWDDGPVSIGVGTCASPCVEFDERLERGRQKSKSWREITSARLRVSTRILADPGRSAEEIARTIVRPVRSEEIAEALSTKARVIGHARTVGGADIVVNPYPMIDALARSDVTLALRIELLKDGAMVARGSAWWTAMSFKGEPTMLLPFGGNCVHLEAIAAPEDPSAAKTGWSLRLTGDPIVALRDFDAKAYWDGQVTVPIDFGRPRAGR